MEIEVISQKENQLLKRKEIRFQIKHESVATPMRLDIRRALADALKANVDLVFVKRYTTKPGMHVATGTANLYESLDQAKLVESDYIIKRNIPPPKPKEEDKKE